MARRRVGQLGFADALVAQATDGRRDALARIAGLLDWARLEALLPQTSASSRGEPAYPAGLLFRALLLQRWYTLSDPALEEALADRLSFRRFCGLALADRTPDHATLWRFRQRLTQDGRLDALWAELQRQLDSHGVLLRQGTLIDATLITSAARRPRMDEGRTSASDPDAAFGANNERRRFEFGYKLHVAVDAGSRLVRSLVLTPGNVQEVRVAPALVQGDKQAVYADRGYDARRFREHLAGRGIACGVIRRAARGRPLTAEQQALNRTLIARRRPVEAVFATLKQAYGFTRMRYFGLERNRAAAVLACMAMNIRRLALLATP